MPKRSVVLARLSELYAQVPVLECRGLCAHSCAQAIDMSEAERAHIAQVHRRRLPPSQDGEPGPCPALTTAGRCAVYADRPMICRLWGVSEGMVCPHGCRPGSAYLDAAQTLTLLIASLAAGGSAHHNLEQINDLLESTRGSKEVAGLLLRLITGDQTALSHLPAAIARHRRSGRTSRPAVQ